MSPAAKSPQAEEPTPSYEQARDELAQIVAQLESGGTSLEQSLALWERGELLVGICQRWLDGARERLSAVVQHDYLNSTPDATSTKSE